MWLYWPQKCPLEELCVEKPKCCVVVDAAVAAGTTVCTVGNTDSFVRSLAPVGLVNRQQQPVDQEVELVKQPAESVPVTGATERYYQVQGRGQVAGAGLASGFGGAPQQRQGFAHSWPVWLEVAEEGPAAELELGIGTPV